MYSKHLLISMLFSLYLIESKSIIVQLYYLFLLYTRNEQKVLLIFGQTITGLTALDKFLEIKNKIPEAPLAARNQIAITELVGRYVITRYFFHLNGSKYSNNA